LSPAPTSSTRASGGIGSITLRPANSVCRSLTIGRITSLAIGDQVAVMIIESAAARSLVERRSPQLLELQPHLNVSGNNGVCNQFNEPVYGFMVQWTALQD